MKYVALEACRKDGRTDMLHFSMFHGFATREGLEPGDSPTHFLGDDLSSPIQIVKSGAVYPHIFRPSLSLVVSDTIRGSLSHIQNIQFAPIQFRKLVNFVYQAGDFSYYQSSEFRQDPGRHQYNDLLERLPDDPALHVRDQTYSELILPNMYRLIDDSVDIRTMNIRMPHLTVEEVELSYSSTLLDRCPLFWAMVFLIDRNLFDGIEHHIDWDYFTSAEVDL